jgi:hypothetical protein
MGELNRLKQRRRKLAAIGHEAIIAFLCDERVLLRWWKANS